MEAVDVAADEVGDLARLVERQKRLGWRRATGCKHTHVHNFSRGGAGREGLM